MVRRILLLLAAALPLSLAGCSGAEGAEDGPAWQTATVPAGHTLDLEYVWPSGRQVAWQWETEAERVVYFQLLNVAGSASYPMVAEHGGQGRGERTVPQSGRYDLVWQNEGAGNVALRFEVPDGYIQRLWPPGEGPACPPPRLLAEARLC